MIVKPDPEPEATPRRITRPAVPSAKLSSEILLISAVLNTGDVGALRTYGITSEHMLGWPQPFNWVISSAERYGECPSIDSFRTAFPTFPLAEHEDVRQAADMVLRDYHKRFGKETLHRAAEFFAADDLTGAQELMHKFKVRETVPKGNNLVRDESFMDMYFDEDLKSGIPVPWKPLQEATSGIHPGNLVYMAARPGQGKSSYATEMACVAVEHGYRVKYYSLEMTEMEMRYKVHARLARQLGGYKNITARRLLDRNVKRDEYKKLLEEIQGQEQWAEFDVHTPRNGLVTPRTIYSDADEYDLVIIDLVTLMANNKGEQAIRDWRVAAEISNELKQIALSTKTPIIGTVQINREGASGEFAPKIHNIAQSDSFGQDPDIAVTFRTNNNVASLWSIEKARFGTGSRFYTKFDPDTMHFPVINADKYEELVTEAQDDE